MVQLFPQNNITISLYESIFSYIKYIIATMTIYFKKWAALCDFCNGKKMTKKKTQILPKFYLVPKNKTTKFIWFDLFIHYSGKMASLSGAWGASVRASVRGSVREATQNGEGQQNTCEQPAHVRVHTCSHLLKFIKIQPFKIFLRIENVSRPKTEFHGVFRPSAPIHSKGAHSVICLLLNHIACFIHYNKLSNLLKFKLCNKFWIIINFK